MTIEELAAASGMTVRNIRSHRTAGLLPPPIVRDRVGFYDSQHLERLRLIQDLQAEGFNLKGIQRLIEQTRGGPVALRTLREMLSRGFETEQPRIYTVDELVSQFGGEFLPDVLDRAQKLGVIVPLDDGRIEAPAPSLIEIAAEVVARGVPITHALAVVAKVQERCQSIGREFVRLFLVDVWKPFADEGYPQERWPEVLETIERLRPLSSQAVLSIYQLTMTREVDAAFGREIARFSRGR